MKKIVINRCFGGFGLSKIAIEKLMDLGLATNSTGCCIDRTDPRLVSIVESLKEKASSVYANLEIIEIPDDVDDWYISEYDGLEHICEGRTWGE